MSTPKPPTSTSKLPDALAALAEYDQFIVWRSEPQANGGKPRKVPLNPETLTAANPHDPAHWMNADVAFPFVELLGADYGVGFVLTENDPFFCLDIDDCLGPDNQWSPLSQQLIQQLPGAAVEVSHSGRGLHIWGTSRPMPLHGCRNVKRGIELYSDKRFIALGRPDANGDIRTDCTAALGTIVGDYFPTTTEGNTRSENAWTAAPCEGWDGYKTDKTLLEHARQSKSGPAMFDGKATVTQLWDADADALAKNWPHAENGYNRSSADAALAQHLAFWTGNDCARIERLMWQSKLVRDKWDREDYLPRTILNAVSQQTTVHQRRSRNLAPDGVTSFSEKDHNACFGAFEKMRIEVRANTRKRNRIEINETGGGWKAPDDGFVADLRNRVADQYWYGVAPDVRPLKYSIDEFNNHLAAKSYQQKVDPFQLWLNALPVWDKRLRLDTWIARLFIVEDSTFPDLVRWASRFVFLGAVQRTFEPGCKLDEIPVFIGPQNIGKSSVLAACLPYKPNAGLIDLFSDNLHLAADPKVLAEALEGRVIVEAAEMSGSTRADLESLKAFLTRQDDGSHRKAYGRHPEESPRRCIIVGTADNDRALPSDPSGNRRFVATPLQKARVKVETFMKQEREQLWAEAIHNYRTRARANLPREFAVIQREANDGFRGRDALEDLIADRRSDLEGKTSQEIGALLGIGGASCSRAIQNRFSNSLKLAGFERKSERINGEIKNVWRSG